MTRPVGVLIAIVVASAVLSAAVDASAQQEFPGCEAWLGPGHVAHPEYPTTCCWPGFVPVPGQPVCVKPGSQAAEDYGIGPQILDADGNPGAPGGHCIPLGATCTLGGAPCCSGDCKGPFPNTVCR